MSSSYTFKWPSGPQEVIVTGAFDDWKKSFPLVKQSNGSFELTIPVKEEGLLYKYVVDGEWLVNEKEKIQKDDNGIDNNVLNKADFHTTSAGSQIPEAGGLIAAQSVTTTVMPTSEGVQTTLGEAGIFIPKDPEMLAAFTKVEERDAKALNYEYNPEDYKDLSPEEKKKQKKKLKKLQYRAKKKSQKQAAAASASDVSGTTTPASATPVPEHVVVVPVSEVERSEAAAKASSKSAEPVNGAATEKKTDGPSTLDPFVIGAIGTGAGAATAEAEAAKISEKETAEPAITPAIQEPIEAPKEEVTMVDPIALAKITQSSNTKYADAKDEVTKVDPVALAEITHADEAKEEPTEIKEEPKEVTKAAAPKEEVTTVDPIALAEITEPTSTKAAAPKEEVTTVDPIALAEITQSDNTKEVAPKVAEEAPKEEVTTVDPVALAAVTKQPEPSAPVVAKEAVTTMDPVVLAAKEAEISAPVVAKEAKEVDASPLHEVFDSKKEEDIIMTQGGHDAKEVEDRIQAATDGKVDVEQINVSPSEAELLQANAEPAEIVPVPEAPKTPVKETKEAPAKESKTPTKTAKKEKKKGGFMSKLKKMFK